MEKILIFLSSSYPFDKGETFVENEIKYLENNFDKIIIFCSSKSNESRNRYLPSNAEALYFNSNSIFFTDTLFSLKGLFTLLFWKELFDVRKKLNIKSITGIVKTLLIEIHKAKKISTFINKKLSTLSNEHKLYFYSYWLNYSSIALVFLKRNFPNGIMFSRAHGWDLYNKRSQHNYLPLRNYLFKNLDAIFPISIDGVNYINRIYKKSDSEIGANIILSKLGTDYVGINPSKIKKTNELVIVSCSQIYPNKQVDLIAKTLVDYDCGQIIKWFHFGSYLPNFSEEYYNEFIEIVNSNKNKSLQINLMGYTPNAQILNFYSNNPVDFLINLSLSEGIPVSIMEAMSFGIPIIATTVGGTPEIVKDGFNGYLLSSTPTSKEVAEIITKFIFLSDAEKLQLRQNAFNTWNEEYNSEKNNKEFVNKLLTI